MIVLSSGYYQKFWLKYDFKDIFFIFLSSTSPTFYNLCDIIFFFPKITA